MKLKTATRTRLATNGEGVARSQVTITAPNFERATFHITGTAPLVICRFSEEAKQAISAVHEEGTTATSKRKRKKIDPKQQFEAARYYHANGWEGFQASAIRNAMISACKIVDIKMTLAKLCVFCEPDGYDKKQPQIPLVRIHGTAAMQQDHVRNRNSGQFSVTTRAVYHKWSADVTIKWDADRFTLKDVANLLARVGEQVGIGCGRHDSKESAGMGWGSFNVAQRK
jgi:hypothetical protein